MCWGGKEHVRLNDKSLIERFCNVADNMFEKQKEKIKKNLLLKGLLKVKEFNADKSLDSPNADGLEEYKHQSAKKSSSIDVPQDKCSMKIKDFKLQEIIDLSTTYRWMCSLGYKFCEQTKCYYADDHECPDGV
eukprot:76627-Ditylum_brightwellii.AAC.1